MKPDYTIDDAHRYGFESGLLYILRYELEELWRWPSDEELTALAEHLAEKKPWKGRDEWEWFIRGSLERWAR